MAVEIKIVYGLMYNSRSVIVPSPPGTHLFFCLAYLRFYAHDIHELCAVAYEAIWSFFNSKFELSFI